MARRKAAKESHLVNNIVIVGAILGFVGFFYLERSKGGAVQSVRSPKVALTNCCEMFRLNRAEIMRTDKPPGDVQSIADIPVDAGWYGVEFFLDPGDLEWLVRYADYVSFASARSAQDWARMTPWERFCAARNEVCKTWPLSVVSIIESDIDEREGRAALQVQAADGSRTVEFVRIDGMWKIKGFFGSRHAYESEALIVAIEKQLPQEYHVRNTSGDDEFYDEEEEY